MDEVKAQLARDKSRFLDEVEEEIKSYIISRKKSCIAICQMKNEDVIHYTWDLDNDIDDFAKVLYHFLKKKPPVYKGYALDSALSKPITEIVIKRWTQLFVKQGDVISKGIIQTLVADKAKLKTFLTRISEVALAGVSKAVEKKIIDKIADQIYDSVQHGAIHTMGQHISNVATTAAGSTVVTTITHILMKLIMMHASQIVAKILASSFLTHLVGALAKKFVLAAVLAAVAQYLWVHFGVIISSSAIVWVAIPAVAAYVIYNIRTFPRKLGEKVSKNVKDELSVKYESVNQTILDKVWTSVIDGDELVKSVQNDAEFCQAMKKLVDE